MKKIIVISINVYQKLLSPDHSVLAKAFFPNGYCKYYPSCSSYAKESFDSERFTHALPRVILRVFRCNPWSKGGFDYPNYS